MSCIGGNHGRAVVVERVVNRLGRLVGILGMIMALASTLGACATDDEGFTHEADERRTDELAASALFAFEPADAMLVEEEIRVQRWRAHHGDSGGQPDPNEVGVNLVRRTWRLGSSPNDAVVAGLEVARDEGFGLEAGACIPARPLLVHHVATAVRDGEIRTTATLRVYPGPDDDTLLDVTLSEPSLTRAGEVPPAGSAPFPATHAEPSVEACDDATRARVADQRASVAWAWSSTNSLDDAREGRPATWWIGGFDGHVAMLDRRGELAVIGSDGRERWSRRLDGDRRMAPVVTADLVYVVEGQHLRAYRVGDGEERWSYAPSGSNGQKQMITGFGWAGGALYLSAGSVMASVDPESGEQNWIASAQGDLHSVAEFDDLVVLAAGRCCPEESVVLLDRSTGALVQDLWASEPEPGEDPDPITVRAPVVTGTNIVGLVDRDPDSRDASVVRAARPLGSPAWQVSAEGAERLLVANDLIIAVGRGEHAAPPVRALAGSSGDEHWRKTVDDLPPGFSPERVIVIGGHLYVAGDDVVMRIEVETGVVDWTWSSSEQITDLSSDGEQPVVATEDGIVAALRP